MKRNVIILIVIVMVSILIICYDKRDITRIVIKSDNTRISMEEYLCKTVMKESKDYDNIETLKALCVVVRSNFIKNYLDNNKYEVTEEVINVKHNKKDEYMKKKIKRALRETKGEVLIYKGNVITIPFHQISNGKTINKMKNQEIPYLKRVECKDDIESRDYLKIKYYDTNKIDEINGMKIKKDFKNHSFEKVGDKIRVVTQGEGHGYGMSLNSAYYMGMKGHTYKEILNRFYRRVNLVKIY